MPALTASAICTPHSMPLESTKVVHDQVIDATVALTTWTAEHPELPPVVRHAVLSALEWAILWGDSVGHALLQLYIVVVGWLL